MILMPSYQVAKTWLDSPNHGQAELQRPAASSVAEDEQTGEGLDPKHRTTKKE